MITLKYIEISNHCSNPIEICRNESLYCVTGANIVLQINYTSKINSQKYRLVVTRRGVLGRRIWMKAVSRYQLSLIRSISTRDVVYNMINIINNVVCDILKLFKQVNPKSSYHKKFFF